VAQAVGLGLGATAAWVEIESIMVAGPLLSLTGLVVAWLSARRAFPLGVVAGLSTGAVSLLCLALVWGLGWGPEPARVPIGIIAVLYAVAFGLFLFRVPSRAGSA
jgi:hypothetical protein